MANFAPYEKVHDLSFVAGVNDARPTALQIVQDQGLVGKMAGKVMIVTGCSSGMGVETARALHVTGADVYMTVRTLDKGKDVREDIMADGRPGKVELLELDLSDMTSVKKAAEDFLSKSKTLNVLVNNAGIMACPKSTGKDGRHELQFQTNHLSHFYFFQLLKDTMIASSTPEFNSRVVSLSSTGHRTAGVDFDDIDFERREYNPWLAYGQSKTANIYFANEIDRRYGPKGLHAVSVHPGFIQTPLQRHMDPDVWKSSASAQPELVKLMKSIPQGAASSVWAAIAKEWEGKGGKWIEDCRVAFPVDDNDPLGQLKRGYSPWAYDEVNEKKLWAISCEMAGLKDDV